MSENLVGKIIQKIVQQLRESFDHPSTKSAEQTFIWLGKFKKILNSMNKRHHNFFLHCLVKARNRYTMWCFEWIKAQITTGQS